MDFTYFIAAFIGLVIGFVAGLIFVSVKGRSTIRLMGMALAASLVVDALLLINWANIGDETVGFLLLDFAFIATYSLAGCFIGALPALAVRSIWRWHKRRGGLGPNQTLG